MNKNHKYLVLRERESLMISPCYWNGIVQSSLVCGKYYGKGLKNSWMLFDSFSREISFYLKEEYETVALYTSKRMFNERTYFFRIEKIVKKKKEDILEFIDYIKNINFSALSFSEQIRLIKKIQKLFIAYDEASIQAWFVGGDYFREMLFKDLNIPENDFAILTTPVEKTKASQFEYEFVKILKLVKTKKINIEKAAEILSDKYGWIPFAYDGPIYWGIKHFIKRLEKESKRNLEKLEKEIRETGEKDKKNLSDRKGLINKYKFNQDQTHRLKIMNELAIWTDDRKMLDYQLNYYFCKILESVGEKYKVPLENLKSLFVEEVEKLPNDAEKYRAISAKRIPDDFLIKYKNGKYEIVLEREKKIILDSIKKISKTSKISGMVASKGPNSIYIGKVRIVLTVNAQNKVKKGDFLVANMTTPNYIISMRKAKGFITDEGGVTCHAAIVAREMNKPCIIGTKNATKILRDGDLIEVDANKGVVKIIKKN
jgi:phosphohistidine swiveling domain-containing protein